MLGTTRNVSMSVTDSTSCRARRSVSPNVRARAFSSEDVRRTASPHTTNPIKATTTRAIGHVDANHKRER
eukprot:2551868-Prymnesium_polylepis.1